MAKLLTALKANRHGHRDWLIGLLIYRHGLRVSEACDLRWDDLDLAKRTIIVRRLKGSSDSTHYLERDEVNGLKLVQRQQEADGSKCAYVFVNERGQPFGRMGIGRMIERAGEAGDLPFPIHVHMLRHSTGYALAARGMDTRRLQHSLGHASITNTVRYTAMSPDDADTTYRRSPRTRDDDQLRTGTLHGNCAHRIVSPAQFQSFRDRHPCLSVACACI